MAIYYVSPTGANSGPGTSVGSPWLTIQYAITNSTTGDTIVLAAGTYTQSASLTLSSRIYRGAGYALSIIDFSAGNYQLVLNGAAITMRDLQIYRSTQTGDTTCIENAVNLAVLTFTRVWFKSLICGLNRAVVGIDGTFGQFVSTTTFTSCLFTGCAKRTSSATAAGIIRSESASTITTLINCVVYNAASLAALALCMIAGGAGKIHVYKNCILVSTQSVSFAQNGSAHTHTGSTTNCIYGSWTSVPAGAAATITSDPLFVDATNANFALRPTSPCINTGTLV